MRAVPLSHMLYVKAEKKMLLDYLSVEKSSNSQMIDGNCLKDTYFEGK